MIIWPSKGMRIAGAWGDMWRGVRSLIIGKIIFSPLLEYPELRRG